ncbi:MAG: efflux RND transporter periplasmic adaptor subunit [Pirellulales bacterium]
MTEQVATDGRTPRSSAERQRAGKRRRAWVVVLLLFLAAVVVPMWLVPKGVRLLQRQRDLAEAATKEIPPPPPIRFPEHPGDPLMIDKHRWDEIGLRLGEIDAAPAPQPLVMDGVLYIDTDDYALVRSRFNGEVVSVAGVPRSTASPTQTKESSTSRQSFTSIVTESERPIRFGDDVKKGQVLAVVWSREFGEKKSELADALSSLEFDRETLQRLSSNEGVVPLKTVREAERQVRQSEIAVDRIEKTLRSWQLSQPELEQLRNELKAGTSLKPLSRSAIGNEQVDAQSVGDWARVEIRSPIDGTIVEKNITVGTLVDPNLTLFKIADLRHLDVRAFAYEEDLAALQKLSPEERHWTVRLKGDKQARPIDGDIDRIGNLIDPIQHTGIVMGWVDNTDRSLRAGQFVTATVTLPDKDPLMSIPATSVVDSDSRLMILVQADSNPEAFEPVEIRLIRYQDEQAYISAQAVNCPRCLRAGAKVVVSGAVEIMAELRSQQSTQAAASREVSP